MNTALHREAVVKALDAITIFLNGALPLLKSHNVSYFNQATGHVNIADKLHLDGAPVTVPMLLQCIANLAKANHASSEKCLSQTPCIPEVSEVDFDNLDINDLVSQIRSLFLGSMKLSSSTQEVIECLQSHGEDLISNSASTRTSKLKFDKIMSLKKTHEVEQMTNLVHSIATLCETTTTTSLNFEDNRNLDGCNSDRAQNMDSCSNNSCSVKYLVDLGSGKGYLSSYLSLLHDYKVLAIDSSVVNTHGSNKRADRMEKVWPGLLRRAMERNETGECSKRGKHWAKRPDKNNLDDKKDINDDENNPRTTFLEGGADLQNRDYKLKNVTMTVDEELNLDLMLKQQFPELNNNEYENFGLIGLHTCGSLGADSLNLFLRLKHAKFICVVPCCFHLLSELEAHFTSTGPVTFPLSKILLDKGLVLGYHALMLASYSVHRIGHQTDEIEETPVQQDFPLPNTILYRSLLEYLLYKKIGSREVQQIKVGRIRGKFSSFHDYVHKIIRKLQLQHLGITDEDIETAYKEQENNMDNFKKFILLKIMFAPLIEVCVLLDRLAYLLEKPEVKSAFIVQLFDPLLSPRCHAVVAVK